MHLRPTNLWRNSDFLKLWIGQTISEVGSRITLVALPLIGVGPKRDSVSDGLARRDRRYCIPYFRIGGLATAQANPHCHRPWSSSCSGINPARRVFQNIGHATGLRGRCNGRNADRGLANSQSGGSRQFDSRVACLARLHQWTASRYTFPDTPRNHWAFGHGWFLYGLLRVSLCLVRD
jgi:hypothetical protein